MVVISPLRMHTIYDTDVDVGWWVLALFVPSTKQYKQYCLFSI